MRYSIFSALCIAFAFNGMLSAWSQITPEDYKRSDNLAARTSGKVYYGNVKPVWIGSGNNFLYENNTPDGTDYVIVNPESRKKTKAFDQKKFAAAFESATGQKAEAGKLPIKNLVFSDRLGSFSFVYDDFNWICNLRDYSDC